MARKKPKKRADEDISFDFSALLKKVEKIGPDKIVMCAFLLFVMLLVLHVRTTPLDLVVTDGWAEQSMTNGLRAQIESQINQQYPHLPQENRNDLVNKEIQTFFEQNGAAVEGQLNQMSQQLKERLRYTGEDGNEYTYLGDLDSYFWMRYTRNWLETGMTCDEIVDDTCYDRYVNAPVGSEMGFNPSIHVFAIGWFIQIYYDV